MKCLILLSCVLDELKDYGEPHLPRSFLGRRSKLLLDFVISAKLLAIFKVKRNLRVTGFTTNNTRMNTIHYTQVPLHTVVVGFKLLQTIPILLKVVVICSCFQMLSNMLQ